MEATFKGAVVVIPTRNRGGLAINAIKSVLGQPGGGIRIVVSDNSTDEQDSALLSRFCVGDARLRYVRPPESLTMTRHWEWALQLALADYQEDHFVFLTDRMVFKLGALRDVLQIASRYPGRVISYHHDSVDDYSRPVRLEQHPWTGKLYEVEMRHLSYLYSRAFLHPCIPRMLNCLAPRDVLRAVESRFGSIFGSLSPDYNFGCRCMEVVANILYYDRSVIVGYALDRSNGASAARGVVSADLADFRAHSGPVEAAFCAVPAPEIVTVGNNIFNEYCLVKEETGSARFFEIDRASYLDYLAREVEAIGNPEMRAEMHKRLAAHREGMPPAGQPKRQRSASGRALSLARALLSPRRWAWRLRRLAVEAGRWSGVAGAQPAWLLASRLFGVHPPDDHRFEFESVEDAFDFLYKYPRRPLPDWPWQEELLRARALECPVEHGQRAPRRETSKIA